MNLTSYSSVRLAEGDRLSLPIMNAIESSDLKEIELHSGLPQVARNAWDKSPYLMIPALTVPPAHQLNRLPIVGSLPGSSPQVKHVP